MKTILSSLYIAPLKIAKSKTEPGVIVQYDYFLKRSLPYIIDGNFRKIPDDHLDHVMGILKPFIRYAALKDSSSQ
ncbi:MAG: hypothetical protein KJN89_06875 [Gammaproteobacteria bacterium]|nr:hypothetical protein [Gammaproteobacteria bacterium]NNJ50082.1 hypothetical protein [Gammaproteobacteria bacterium]